MTDRKGRTHVEGFKVFAGFFDELLAALVALWQPCVWGICLRQGEEGEGGACEGEEVADVLFESLFMCHVDVSQS